jgi:hypothetical protein
MMEVHMKRGTWVWVLCALFLLLGLGPLDLLIPQEPGTDTTGKVASETAGEAVSEIPGEAVGESTGQSASEAAGRYDYKLLATSKTSTMQKEMDRAAAKGFRFGGVMGGSTAFGGSECVIIMQKNADHPAPADFAYKLLATSKTSTMQKELQQAGDEGYEYMGQTVFSTKFKGSEVVVILEKDRSRKPVSYEYKLLATSKTSTMQKELDQAGSEGYEFVGVTVSETSFGGSEIVTILRKKMP